MRGVPGVGQFGRPRTRSASRGRPVAATSVIAAPSTAAAASTATATSDVAAPSPDWQQNVERRLATSERVLGEMHGMLQSSQRDAATAATLQAPAGSQPSSSATETVVAGSSHTIAADDAPWPTANALTGSGAVGERASNFASSSLPVYAHVPMRTRTQIWSGELIDLATLLIERKHDEQNNYKCSLVPARDGAPPQMQVSAKPKLTIDNIVRLGRKHLKYIWPYCSYSHTILLKPQK